MRYLLSRIKRDNEERIYRIYTADCLYYQGQNKTLTKRYYDILRPQVETRDAEDILSDLTGKFGLKVK